MGKSRQNPVTDEQIIAMYHECHSTYKTAERLGIGDTTVNRVLHRYNIPRIGLQEYRNRITLYQGQEAEMRQCYEAGMTLKQLQERFGSGSDYAVKHAIKRAGGTLRINPAPTIQVGERERIEALHAQGMSQVDISLAIGRSQSFVSRVFRRHGIVPFTGQNDRHGKWRNGRHPIAGGYIRVFVAPDDPYVSMANNAGYVLEHRLVMARALGRSLTPHETVHHIDGDSANNDPANLQLRQGRHGNGVVLHCRDCGSHNVGFAPLAAPTPSEA